MIIIRGGTRIYTCLAFFCGHVISSYKTPPTNFNLRREVAKNDWLLNNAQ